MFTVHAGVVHQDDLLEQNGGGRVQDAVHRPQQSAPGLVVKHDDHAGGRQGGAPLEGLLNASAAERGKQDQTKKKKNKDHKDASDLDLHTLPCEGSISP